MRQPFSIGVSVNAKTPKLEPLISETTLSSGPPTEDAWPCQEKSKLAPPEPRTPWLGSPRPSPCASLPHSTAAFQIASGAPVAPGKFGSSTRLSRASGSLKLLKTRTSRWGRRRAPPRRVYPRAGTGARRKKPRPAVAAPPRQRVQKTLRSTLEVYRAPEAPADRRICAPPQEPAR